MQDLTNWTARPTPGHERLVGRYAVCEPYKSALHAEALHKAVGADPEMWAYMAIGPFATPEALDDFYLGAHKEERWRTMVIRGAETGDVLGMASYMRLRENHGSAEVGAVAFSGALRRTPTATEAMYLMAKHVFDLGYRRYEWKCNDANDASKRAALRFGFQYEGVFRNDMVMKGQNRDTAWYAMTDGDWPRVKAAFETWLTPQNFDAAGRQIERLADLRAA